MALRKPDLAKARDDLGTFAKLAGTPLAKFQIASLRLTSRATYIVGPRQSGKSRSIAVLAAWWAFRKPNQHVLIVSAGEVGSKRLLATIADLVVSSPLLSASVVDEQASLIRLSNGSSIRSLPASSKAIRGWSVDLLVIDEAVEIDDSIIDAAIPTTAARPDARIVFSSTAGAPVGRAYETYMAGLDSRSSTVRSYRWRLKDAKWISRASVEHQRNTLPPWKFAAEYEGEWAGSVDSLFPLDLLRRASADLELPDLANLRGPARLFGGVDWADSGPDQTAVVAIARVPARGDARGPVFAVWPVRVFPVGTEVTKAAVEIASAPARWGLLSYEVNGLGAGASQVLRDELARTREADQTGWIYGGGDATEFRGPALRQNPTYTSWERKADGLGRLRLLAEQGQIVFQRDEKLMRQLATVRVEHRQHSVGIAAPPGGHDDLVLAAFLASGVHATRKGRIRNLLAEAARRNLPEPPLPEPGEWIEAGDLLVPRRPHLISVGGSEVTPPVGDRAAAPDPLREAREQLRRHRNLIGKGEA